MAGAGPAAAWGRRTFEVPLAGFLADDNRRRLGTGLNELKLECPDQHRHFEAGACRHAQGGTFEPLGSPRRACTTATRAYDIPRSEPRSPNSTGGMTMKTFVWTLLSLVLRAATWAEPLAPDPPRLGRSDLTGYPWSEATELVRIPKPLLRYLDFSALDFSINPETPKWSVSPAFVGVLSLTPADATKLSLMVEQVRMAARRAEGMHLKLVDGVLPMGPHRDPAGLTVLDERTFLLEPYQAALEEIRRNARMEILRLLGRQRADEFWSRSWLEDTLSCGDRSESFTFRLIEIRCTRSVDLVKICSGGSMGGPYFEEADQFAPEPLKPILTGWRASVREYRRTNSTAGAEIPPTPAVTNAPQALAEALLPPSASTPPKLREPEGHPEAGWDEGAEYIAFPKELIPMLAFPAVSDNEISPEAEVLFGFTPAESRAATGLFNDFRHRFELLEIAHLRKHNAINNRFILEKFKTEAESLGDDWVLHLQDLAGSQRAQLLNRCIREPATGFPRRGFDPRNPLNTKLHWWPVWLLRGQRALEISLNVQDEPQARFSLEVRDLEDPDGVRSSRAGSIRTFPGELRHLFRFEDLESDRRPGVAPF